MASIAFPSIAVKTTLSDGTTYGYARVKASQGKPTLLFLHGYPSSSYDWRHQVDYLSKKGFGLLVPDLLGYGDTSKPAEIGKYSMRTIGRQVAEILDKEQVGKVVAVAHDWGCGLLSAMARWHANRFSSLVFMAVGYIAHSLDGIDEINEATKLQIGYECFGYWYFHNADDAASVIATHHESYMSLLYPADRQIWIDHMCPPGAVRAFIEADKIAPSANYCTKEEVDMHQKILEMGGYQGPLNWYKQQMRGHSTVEEADLKPEDRIVSLPTLLVRAEKDPICLPAMQEEGMRPFVKNMKVASVDTSHWQMLEKPNEVNKILEDWALSSEA